MTIFKQIGNGETAWFDVYYNNNLILHNQKQSDVDDIIKACEKDNEPYDIIQWL